MLAIYGCNDTEMKKLEQRFVVIKFIYESFKINQES